MVDDTGIFFRIILFFQNPLALPFPTSRKKKNCHPFNNECSYGVQIKATVVYYSSITWSDEAKTNPGHNQKPTEKQINYMKKTTDQKHWTAT